MTTHATPNARSASTTFAWRKVKISGAPQASKPQPPAGRRLHALRRRNPRDPLTVTIVYRGGPECWWEIRARGVVLRRPGHASVHDVLSALDGGGSSS